MAAPSTLDPSLLRAETLAGVGCIVTGGASGIGFEVARALARLGGSVGIVDLSEKAAAAAAARLVSECGGSCAAAAADVMNSAEIARGFSSLFEHIGPIGVLVNCAGIMTPRMVPLTEMPDEDFDRMLAVHVKGTYVCSKAALPAMQRQRFGRIINVSSVLGILGLPNRIGYATAKTAIIGFTRALAVEVGRFGVTVNAVAPGYILTDTLQQRVDEDMIDYARLAERAPAGRWGLPEEIARVIAFLALPASGFITGATIPVDGGYTIRGDPNEDIGERPASLDAVRALFRARP